MQPSSLQTLTVATLGVAGVNPTVLASASDIPVRVYILNVGPLLIFIGFSSQDVVDAAGMPTSATFQLPTLRDATLILAPGQKAYAGAAGAGGFVSVTVSEAFPGV